MKSFKTLSRTLKEEFDPKEVEIANKTSRSAGAVSAKAIVPRHVEQHASKDHHILDFGAGKDAVHTKRLREKGFNVTAHEFGANQKEGLHDKDALKKTYHHVYASNVLNVQSSPKMLNHTLDQIHKAVKPGGHFTGNLPESPRKFEGLNHELVHHELKRRFHDVKIVGGTKKAPLYHATGPKEKIDESVNIYEENDTEEKNEMAQTQLHFIEYASKEILEYLEMGGEIEEWYQNKLSKVHSDMEGLHSWMEGEKRRTDMVKEELDEAVVKVRIPKETGAEKAYRQITGKTVDQRLSELDKIQKDLERQRQEYIKQGIIKAEEVEQIDELKVSTLTRYGTKAMQAYGRNPEKDEKRLQGIQKARAKVQQKMMKKEEVEELDEGKYGGFRIGPKRPRYPYVPQGDTDPRTGLPLGFTPIKDNKDNKPEEPKKVKEEIELDEENKPTNPELWSRAKALAKSKFDVYPSAYANGWAAKWYKSKGGGWKSVSEEVEQIDEVNYAGWSFDDLHKHLKKNGWELDRSTGHKQYVHPKSSRPIAVPHKHGKTVAPGTVRNIHQKMKDFIQEGVEPDIMSPAAETLERRNRKLNIVKDIMKKKNSDKFQKSPVLSSEIMKENK